MSGPPAEPAASSPDSRPHAGRRSLPPMRSLVAAAVAPRCSSHLKPAAAHIVIRSMKAIVRGVLSFADCFSVFSLAISPDRPVRSDRTDRTCPRLETAIRPSRYRSLNEQVGGTLGHCRACSGRRSRTAATADTMSSARTGSDIAR